MKFTKTFTQAASGSSNQQSAGTSVDLFESLKDLLRCSYISDLRMEPYNTQARLIVTHLNLDAYSPNQVNALLSYIGAA